MTPPTVQFIPAAAAAARYGLTGDLVYSTSVRFNATNTAETGDTGDFDIYFNAPIRNGTTFIRVYLTVTGWSSVDDFLSSTGGLDDASFAVNGSTFVHTSVTTNTGTGTLLDVRFNASSATVSTFWSTMSDGDPFALNLNY